MPVVLVVAGPFAVAGDERLVEGVAAEQVVHRLQDGVAVGGPVGEVVGRRDDHRVVGGGAVGAPDVLPVGGQGGVGVALRPQVTDVAVGDGAGPAARGCSTRAAGSGAAAGRR